MPRLPPERRTNKPEPRTSMLATNDAAGVPNDWICTASGRIFRPRDPDPSEIAIEDIAAALSKQCRFAGHSRTFYSVAQHCLHVAQVLEPTSIHLARWGLLHDATEAYLVDIPGPIKHAPELHGYREIEAALEAAIASAFGLVLPRPSHVKDADRAVFAAEVRDLMPVAARAALLPGTAAWPGAVKPMAPDDARVAFLEAFHRYGFATAG